MLSDTVLLAIIAGIPPSLAAAAALIVALRSQNKIDRQASYDEGAQDARTHQQRKTDQPVEEDADEPSPPPPNTDHLKG